MIIKTLEGFFGVINGDKFSFNKHLNIIFLENEGGKTTISNFIRVMLYGINTSVRSKKNFLSDKEKYSNQSSISGTLCIENDGHDISIIRTGTQKSPLSNFQSFYTDTGAKTDLTISNISTNLLGISEQSFVNSAFIDGCNLSVISNDEFESKINSLATTGDNSSGVSNSLEYLKRLSLDIRANANTGLLPICQNKISVLQQKITDFNLINQKLSTIDTNSLKLSIQNKTDIYTKLCLDSKNTVDILSLNKIKNRLENMQKPQTYDTDIVHRYINLKANFNAQKLIFDEYLLKYEQEFNEKNIFENTQNKSKKIKITLSIISFVLAILSIIVASFSVSILSTFIFTLPLFIFSIFMFLGFKRKKTFNSKYNDFSKKTSDFDAISHEFNAILQQIYKISGNTDIDKSLEIIKTMEKSLWEYNSLISEKNRLEQEISKNQSLYDVESKIKSLDLEIKSDTIHYENILAEKSKLIANLDIIGDILTLKSEEKQLLEEKSALEFKLQAINLARDTIKFANDELSSKISPKIAALCSEYLAIITDNRHNKVLVREGLEVLSQNQNSILDVLRLSSGTKDQLYLSLRLAICELLLNKNIPLILDDPFITFDERRTKNTVKLLEKLSHDRQIILFTSRKIGDV